MVHGKYNKGLLWKYIQLQVTWLRFVFFWYSVALNSRKITDTQKHSKYNQAGINAGTILHSDIASIIPMSAVVTKTLLNTVTAVNLVNNNDIVFLLIVFNYR